MKLGVKQRIITGFAVAILVLVVVGWLSFRTTERLRETLIWVAHTHEVIAHLESLSGTLMEAESSQRGYLLAYDQQYLIEYYDAKKRTLEELKVLEADTKDNVKQKQSLGELQPLVQSRLQVLEDRISLRQKQGLQVAANAISLNTGKAVMDHCRAVIAKMHEEENRLLGVRVEVAQNSTFNSLIIILAGSGVAICFSALSLLLILRDLQLRQQAEEQRDRFFEVSRDMICVTGFDGYFKMLNPAFEQVLGFTRAELMAKHFTSYVHPDDVNISEEKQSTLLRGQEVVNFENRYRDKSGHYRWLSWNARADLGKQAIFATARDVTEEKATKEHINDLNTDLQRRAAQLEAANKELEAFSYSVSHDLRAPLRHIDGFVAMLSKQAATQLDDKGKRYLKIIGDAAKQMSNLIDDLLVFSRMGRSEIRHTMVDLNGLVHEAVASLETETAHRHIEWQIQQLPNVQADPAMLRQVWVNLIANAVKYSRPRDPAKIGISYQETPEEFIFSVSDNGVGFDMDYVHKLFGVFQRLHRPEEFEGTGIGLANVQRIIIRHGGRVWAESKINEGAIFYFSLPKKIFV